MRVAKEGTEINERFFQALQKLKEDKLLKIYSGSFKTSTNVR